MSKSNYTLTLDGIEKLEAELERINAVTFEAVKLKQVTEMFNRARRNLAHTPGGTPVDTGELRISVSKTNDEVGYTKEYAPHVEHGHRTRNGGYVKGQRFLKANTDTQREIYKTDLRRVIRGK